MILLGSNSSGSSCASATDKQNDISTRLLDYYTPNNTVAQSLTHSVSHLCKVCFSFFSAIFTNWGVEGKSKKKKKKKREYNLGRLLCKFSQKARKT